MGENGHSNCTALGPTLVDALMPVLRTMLDLSACKAGQIFRTELSAWFSGKLYLLVLQAGWKGANAIVTPPFLLTYSTDFNASV